MLWVVFALLTGAAVFAVLWPLSRAPKLTDARELDVAFYKAQADEIDRDMARGVIGAGDAAAARTEAARRLMAASHRPLNEAGRSSPLIVRVAALAIFVFIPVVALALYTHVGAPNLPDDPLEARLNASPAKMDMAAMIARIERNVAANPNDARGWSLLARIYPRLGRSDDAVTAYKNELRLLGPNEERLSGLGEMETEAAGGQITSDARQKFEQAVKLDPKSPRARFYLGLASEQAGDKTGAITTWKAIVADSPPDAPWVPAIQERIAAAGGEPTPLAGAGTGKGPPAQMAAAVAAMPRDQQQAMIHRMVDGLADRLKTNGGDIEGWLRLVRAYRVLDEGDKAKVALGDARRNFAADPAATKRLDELAHELGLEG